MSNQVAARMANMFGTKLDDKITEILLGLLLATVFIITIRTLLHV